MVRMLKQFTNFMMHQWIRTHKFTKDIIGKAFVWFFFFGCKACRILAPQPGIEPTPPALGGEFLTTGPPGEVSRRGLNLGFKKSKL